MNCLRITDLGKGRVQVSWQGPDGDLRTCDATPFVDPLTPEDRAELKWYLEEFARLPTAPDQWHAQRVEERMASWGEALFKQVFVGGDAENTPRAFYREAVHKGLDGCELCISSDDPAFLSIPWELIRDPAPGGGYLAPSLAGLHRHHSGQPVQAPVTLPRKGPFRILLVIARPSGAGYIPLGTIARPILDAVRPLGRQVHIDLLRPPTFDALQELLNANRGLYHLVHFDGHGVFAAGQGHLAFERGDETAHVVSSDDLGQLLATARVPLFFLNACQSAEEGASEPFSSVASELVATGVSGVVAMSYSVYAQTAAIFMQRLYEGLASHASLAEAVASSRRTLFAEPERQSILGPIELRDWPVPALYQQPSSIVPIPKAKRAPAAEKEGIDVRRQAEEACPEGQYGFIGRDDDILLIERALLHDKSPWVLISGIGGVGKTELLHGFARWYAETGGCPGGVFAASFREKADLGQVIGSVAGFGTDLSMLSEQEQERTILTHLRDNPCLLVWDNFEPVAGYPPGAEPLASDEERGKLPRFLQALRGGKSRVIITTRKPDEGWLGIAYHLIELEGLAVQDAGRLAKLILQTVGRKPEDYKDDPDYVKLISLLRGHPRSLEVVLPQLRKRSPAEVIQALQHRVDSSGEAMEDASLAYAFSQMSEQTRRHLPFVGLFSSYVDADTLGAFVHAGDDQQKAYEEVVGEPLDASGWEAVLDEAAGAGLARSLGSRIYELHPTLPPFFRRQLVSQVGGDGLSRLDNEFVRFYAAWGGSYLEGMRKADPNALFAAQVEEANLLRALRLAESGEKWALAQAIVQPLGEFYRARGRLGEWRALRTVLLRRVGDDFTPDSDRDRANLWMHLRNNDANDALDRNDLAAAEAGYGRILDYLTSLHDPAVERLIAGGYHQLGRIAQQRLRLDEAEQWFLKALATFERLGLHRDAADEYHQLGVIAQQRRQLDDAEKWFRRALETYERLRLEREAAGEYSHLGINAQLRQRSDEAEQWLRKALEIRERLGLDREAARDYHNLGIIAQERLQVDEAERWFRKALGTKERLGLEWEAASDYHHLGMNAHLQLRLDEAGQWFRKALEVYEGLGNPSDMVETLAQLGLLSVTQRKPAEAVAWLGRALAIAAEHQMAVGAQVLRALALIMREMGEEAFAAAWRQAFQGQEPPLEALRKIQS